MLGIGGSVMNTDNTNQQTERSEGRLVREQLSNALLGENPSQYFIELRKKDALRPWFQEVADLIGVAKPCASCGGRCLEPYDDGVGAVCTSAEQGKRSLGLYVGSIDP